MTINIEAIREGAKKEEEARAENLKCFLEDLGKKKSDLPELMEKCGESIKEARKKELEGSITKAQKEATERAMKRYYEEKDINPLENEYLAMIKNLPGK